MREQDTAISPDNDGTEPPAEFTETAETTGPKSREARQRVELRETKARLERMQRGEVERIAAARFADPSDVWLGGLDLASVLSDAGDVDCSKVASAIDALIEAHPHWRAP